MIANFEQYSSVLSVVSKGFSMLGCLIFMAGRFALLEVLFRFFFLFSLSANFSRNHF
jgi:hypothetical protein